jgi:hypothetical protein
MTVVVPKDLFTFLRTIWPIVVSPLTSRRRK